MPGKSVRAGALALSLGLSLSACSLADASGHLRRDVQPGSAPAKPWPGAGAPGAVSPRLFGAATATPDVRLPDRPNVVMITADEEAPAIA